MRGRGERFGFSDQGLGLKSLEVFGVCVEGLDSWICGVFLPGQELRGSNHGGPEPRSISEGSV